MAAAERHGCVLDIANQISKTVFCGKIRCLNALVLWVLYSCKNLCSSLLCLGACEEVASEPVLQVARPCAGVTHDPAGADRSQAGEGKSCDTFAFEFSSLQFK